MSYGRHGEVVQSGLYVDPNDHERIDHPVEGVIWRVNLSDEFPTLSATRETVRSYEATAHVVIVNDGTQNTWEVQDAVLPAPGPGGWQNYAEWLPRGCSQAVDGTDFRDAVILDYSLLDGERCIVQFIGGLVTMPVVTGYLPHPRNRADAATSGAAPGTLNQRGRGPTVRWAGTTFAWGADGSLNVDTSGANEEVVGSPGDVPVRTVRDGGGNVNVTMKSDAELAVDFNAPVADPTNPSTMQANPPDPATLAAEEAVALERRVARQAEDAAAAAAAVAQGVRLGASAVALGVAEAQLVAAQAAAAARAARASTEAAATTATLVAQAAAEALAGIEGPATRRLREIAAAQAKLLDFNASQAAIRAAEQSAQDAEAAIDSAQSLVTWATEAVAAGRAPQTSATRSVDRILPDGTYVRARSRVEWDEYMLSFVAGLTARLMARGGDDSVEVGGTPESPPTNHATLAEPLKATFDVNAEAFNALVDAVNEVRVLVDLQPVAYSARRFPDAARSSVVKVK